MNTLAQAVRPTARAIRWAPPALVAGLLVGAALLAAARHRPADLVLAVAAAGLAATTVAGLQDPAAALLAPVPTSAMRRRLLRLALLGLPMLAAWWLLAALTTTAQTAGPGPLLALTSCGVAVAVWAPTERAVLFGASVPVVLFAADQLLPLGGAVSDLLASWRTAPWWVLGAALVLCAAGRQR